MFLDLQQKTIEDRAAELLVRHLAPSKPDHCFDLRSIFQKPENVILFELEVMLVDSRSELNLFDENDLLLLLGFVVFLLLLKQELPVVHDLADGRLRRRRDLYEIEIFLFGHVQRLLDRNDTDLSTLVVNQTYLGSPDQFVDFVLRFYWLPIEASKAAWRVDKISS